MLNTLGAALTEASFLIEKLDVETPENAKSEMLRSDLRAAQRLLRRSYDFLVDGENVTFKGEDKASDLARDVGRALRGT